MPEVTLTTLNGLKAKGENHHADLLRRDLRQGRQPGRR